MTSAVRLEAQYKKEGPTHEHFVKKCLTLYLSDKTF